MDKRWAVIGASGLVGNALVRELRKRDEKVVGTFCNNPIPNSAHLDLENPDTIDKFIKDEHPNIAFILAAITNVDKCETDPHTYKVNVNDTVYLIRALNRAAAKVVFFSSGYVFSGEKSNYVPEDSPSPINMYGIQKVKTELMTIASSPKNLIVRTIGVFGKELARKNFVYQVYDALIMKKTVYVPVDQYISPIHAIDLANISINAVNGGMSGIAHIVGNFSCTKYFFACEIAKMFGLSSEYIVGLTSDEMKQKAKRPKNCILGHGSKSSNQMSMPYPDFLAGLERFKNEI